MRRYLEKYLKMNRRVKTKLIVKKDIETGKEIIEEIVKIHLDGFKGFFLSFLGPAFLRLLYKCIASDENGILLVTYIDERIIGFVSGVTDQKSFYEKLLRTKIFHFARASLVAAFKKPKIIMRLLRALKRPEDTTQMSSKTCLMSICVHPDYQGLGLGKILIQEFCEELVKRGISSVCLTTDRDNNDNVNKFYQKLGFRLVRSFITNEGRPMNEYLKLLG